MKRLLGLSIALWASLSVASAQGVSIIKGRIEGIPSGRLYLLTQGEGAKLDTLGAVDFKSSRFELKARVDAARFATLVVGGYSGGFDFFVEPASKYEALLRNGAGWYIRGGEYQERWTKYQSRMSSLVDSINQRRKRYDELRSEGKFRSASRLNDTLTLMLGRYEAEQADFLRANDNVLSAHLAQSQAESKNLSLDASLRLYENLGSGAKQTVPARLMSQRIERLRSTVKGNKAPNFSMPDTEGVMHSLHDIKGKIKIVDFWASWCGPCKLSNKHLKAIYPELHAKGLTIVGVSLDDNRDKWLKAIEAQGLPWMHISDLKAFNSQAALQYNIKSIPALFVLDEDNNIIARDLKGKALEDFLRERLP